VREDGALGGETPRERSERQKLGGGAGYFDVVGGPENVNAVTWAFFRGIDDIQPQVGGHVGAATGAEEQFAGPVLHIGQTVHVKLKNLGRILDTKAVTGTEVLVHPHAQRILGHVLTVPQGVTAPITTL